MHMCMGARASVCVCVGGCVRKSCNGYQNICHKVANRNGRLTLLPQPSCLANFLFAFCCDCCCYFATV